MAQIIDEVSTGAVVTVDPLVEATESPTQSLETASNDDGTIEVGGIPVLIIVAICVALLLLLSACAVASGFMALRRYQNMVSMNVRKDLVTTDGNSMTMVNIA